MLERRSSRRRRRRPRPASRTSATTATARASTAWSTPLVGEAELDASSASRSSGCASRMLLANRLRIEDVYRRHPDIADEPVEGPLVHHRPAPHGDDRAEPAGGRRPPDPLAAAVGVVRPGAAARDGHRGHRPPHRRGRRRASRPCTRPSPGCSRCTSRPPPAPPSARTCWAWSSAPPTSTAWPMSRATRTGSSTATWPPPTATTAGCSSSCSGTARLGLWHLKTPVHMLALDALDAAYPDARFLWTHRDPAEVLGSVCSLIAYTRSWVSDRDDSAELGAPAGRAVEPRLCAGRWPSADHGGEEPLRRHRLRRPQRRPGGRRGRRLRTTRPRTVRRGGPAHAVPGRPRTPRDRTASTSTPSTTSVSPPTGSATPSASTPTASPFPEGRTGHSDTVSGAAASRPDGVRRDRRSG